MAVKGDMFQHRTRTVASGAKVQIKPAAAGNEVVIHNIYVTGDAEIAITDGTNKSYFDTNTGKGGWFNVAFHISYSGMWIEVNSLQTSIDIIADGVYTK